MDTQEEELDDDYTDATDDNLLGIFDKAELNAQEAKGILRAEEYILNLELPLTINYFLLLNIHQEAFKHLYEWAGKYRTSNPTAGTFLPTSFRYVPNELYQFMEEVNYRYTNVKEKEDLVKCLAYAHHGIVKIHPFTNGNGRSEIGRAHV